MWRRLRASGYAAETCKTCKNPGTLVRVIGKDRSGVTTAIDVCTYCDGDNVLQVLGPRK